jgi:hypothetical protein
VQGTGTNSGAVFRDGLDERERRYQAISQDSRYGHYTRIPERICRCLDYFKVASDRKAVKARLQAYYLFIGVVDDAIDSSELETGRDILRQLENANPVFDAASNPSHAALVTEAFKAHISPDTYPAILARLDELYRAVVTEREATTVIAYIEQRKAIGWLTAEISYLLIRPLLRREHADVRSFLQKVGEVGCLMDSLIDLRADAGAGLISFRPNLKDHLELAGELLRDGLAILLKHACLLRLFLEAAADNVLDFRVRQGGRPASPVPISSAEVRGSRPALQMPGS